MSHWRKVFTIKKYRQRWLFTVGATLSSLFFVIFIGGRYGGTVSAEIERRRLNNQPIGLLLRLVRFIGGFILGRDHWEISYHHEETWFNTKHITKNKLD